MYLISKEFEFDFGHRVWNQELDISMSGSTLNKCRFLHGHRGKLIIELKAEKLTNGMVIDFNNLNFFKKFIDDNIDHKFLVDINDPLMKPHNMNLKDIGNGMKKAIISNEITESYVYLDFVPTAENISKWIFEILRKKLGNIVHSVIFYETPKSKAQYTERL